MSTAYNEISLRHAGRWTIDRQGTITKRFCVTDTKSVKDAAQEPKDLQALYQEKCFLVPRDVQVLLTAGHMIDKAIAQILGPKSPHMRFADYVQEAWEQLPMSDEDQEAWDRRYQEEFGSKPPKEAPGQQKLDLGGKVKKSKVKGDDGSTAEPAGPVVTLTGKIGEIYAAFAGFLDRLSLKTTVELNLLEVAAMNVGLFDKEVPTWTQDEQIKFIDEIDKLVLKFREENAEEVRQIPQTGHTNILSIGMLPPVQGAPDEGFVKGIETYPWDGGPLPEADEADIIVDATALPEPPSIKDKSVEELQAMCAEYQFDYLMAMHFDIPEEIAHAYEHDAMVELNFADTARMELNHSQWIPFDFRRLYNAIKEAVAIDAGDAILDQLIEAKIEADEQKPFEGVEPPSPNAKKPKAATKKAAKSKPAKGKK